MIDRNSPAFIAACDAFNAAYDDDALAGEIITAILEAYEKALWQPIETAPTGGEYESGPRIWARVRADHDRYPGRWFEVWHEGFSQTTNGKLLDLGWALYPGQGGMPESTFDIWRPLPTPPEEV